VWSARGRSRIHRMSRLLSPRFGPRERAASDYLPIADHGVIGDLRTVALVGTDGTIDWYCPLRFDAPSVFGAILDSGDGGYYRIAPVVDCSTKQLYVPDTNVLITRFLSPQGVGEVQDFMPVGDRPRLIRRVTCARGEIHFRLECEPRFNYGPDRHEAVLTAGGALFRSPSLSLALSAPTPLLPTARGVLGEFVLVRRRDGHVHSRAGGQRTARAHRD